MTESTVVEHLGLPFCPGRSPACLDHPAWLQQQAFLASGPMLGCLAPLHVLSLHAKVLVPRQAASVQFKLPNCFTMSGSSWVHDSSHVQRAGSRLSQHANHDQSKSLGSQGKSYEATKCRSECVNRCLQRSEEPTQSMAID